MDINSRVSFEERKNMRRIYLKQKKIYNIFEIF